MHCPEKYKTLGHFHEYFEGKKLAPILTVLIGGNHEAVNSLR
jgi:lariat debranching enzyme